MEGKQEKVEKVYELLDAGVYQPDIIKLIYDEATPERVKESPFELQQERKQVKFEKEKKGKENVPPTQSAE